MRTRLRLGAATVVALGALLLATALASPAFAWHSTVDVEAYCVEETGEVQVDYTVAAWEEGHAADVEVFYKVSGGDAVEEPGGEFSEENGYSFDGSFVLPAGTTGYVVVVAKATWTDSDEKPSKNYGKAKLPEDCEHDTTTSSSIEDTTTSSSIEDTTSTSEEETTTTKGEETTTTAGEETTTSAALGETSTTAGGQLPFTGASSGPMLLAGIALVGGGLLFLWTSRARNAAR